MGILDRIREKNESLNKKKKDAPLTLQGVLVLSTTRLNNAHGLLSQIVEEQKAAGAIIAPDIRLHTQSAGTSLNDKAYIYATLREAFAHLNDDDIMKKTKVKTFQASDGNSGSYYMVFNK